MDIVSLLENYWWVIIIFLIGVFVNHLVELTKLDHTKFLKARQHNQLKQANQLDTKQIEAEQTQAKQDQETQTK